MSEQDPNDPATETEARAEDLSDELAKKYDPERLLRMVSKRAGRGEALDHSLRSKYEKRFGVDLGHVRIYTGEFAEEFNRQRSAYAVTVGSTGMILMGNSPDKSMGSVGGQALLAHELTHVAQAQGGLHRKSTYDGEFTPAHEQEADEVEQSVEAELSGGGGESKAGAAPGAGQAGKERMKQALEKVKARVLEMAADAVRTQMFRNGYQRRP